MTNQNRSPADLSTLIRDEMTNRRLYIGQSSDKSRPAGHIEPRCPICRDDAQVLCTCVFPES